MTCSSNSQSIGYHDNLGLINGEAVVILKDTTSGNFDIIKNADSLFGTDDLHLDLKRYAMGVAYNETGDNVKNEALAKAELITIKSFVLGRTAPGSRTTVGMGYKTDTIDGKTVFYMRGNTYDQGFCDIYEGCQDGSKYAKSLVKSDPNGEMTGNKKPALSKEDIANLEKWYDETAGEFIFDDKNKAFNGSQYRDYNTSNLCKPGSCLSQLDAISLAKSGMDYKTILFQKAYSENRFTLYNSDTETISAVSVNCNDASSVCGINEKDFIYYSQKVGEYSSEAFCNSDSTIKEGGCGITSMAMVIANLSDVKVNPSITNTEAYNGGFCGSERGTDAGYFSDAAKRYGLSLTSVVKTDATNIKKSSQKIIETIKDGGLVIINVNASWLNGGSGHYIVAKSLDSNNDLIIADPYADSLTSPVRNNVSASKIIEDYVDNNHGWYMFTSDKSSAIAKKYCKVPDEEKGYLGNPINPDDTTRDFLNVASAKCFPKYCSGGPHSGFDLNSSTGAPAGTPVYAMDSGIVTYAGTYARNCYGFCVNNNAPGLGVTINHGNGYETGYWHFSKRVVNKGEKVSKGQLIGYVGNTGNSTGPHLHITLKNIKLYSKYGWNGARGSDRKGFMNAAKYINKNKSYVGQSR